MLVEGNDDLRQKYMALKNISWARGNSEMSDIFSKIQSIALYKKNNCSWCGGYLVS